MHVKSFSQGLNLDLAQPGLEPKDLLIPKPCLPLDHDASRSKIQGNKPATIHSFLGMTI